jgi:addiction module RelE/StbE family toxin
MARLIWTESALQDLDAIADYISLDKPEAAKKFVQRVFRDVERLIDFPDLGSRPKELSGTAYRHLVIAPVRVFYRVDGEDILIIHVMRGEKLLRLSDLTER